MADVTAHLNRLGSGAPRYAGGVLALLLLVLAACPSPPAPVDSSATATAPDDEPRPPRSEVLQLAPVATLTPGEPHEGTLEPGEEQILALALAADTYLTVQVEQLSVDVEIDLLLPDTRPVTYLPIDFRPAFHQHEEVTWITEQPGRHLLTVRSAPGVGEPGSYAARITEHRLALDADRQLFAAQRVYLHAVQLGRSSERAAKEKAIPVYMRAIPMFEALGEKDWVASCYNNLGVIARQLDQIELALDYYRQACELGERSNDDRLLADCHYNQGALYSLIDDDSAALDRFEIAYASYARLENQAGMAKTLSRMTDLHSHLGQLEEALELLHKVLLDQEKLGDLAAQAATAQRIAGVYLQMGEFQNALERNQRALEIFKATGKSGDQAALLIQMGLIYNRLGDVEEALAQFEKSRALFAALGRRHDEASAIANIAYVQSNQGQHQEALSSFAETLKIFQETHDRDSEAHVLVNMASSYRALGQPRKGDEALDRALTIFKEIGQPHAQAITLATIGRARFEDGSLDAASTALAEALTLARLVSDRRTEATSLATLAAVERDRGDLPSALGHIEDAIGITEAIRTKVDSLELRSLFFAIRREQYELAIDLLTRLAEREPAGDWQARAFAISEKARARSLIELLTEAEVDVRAGIEPSLKARERAAASRLAELHTELIDARSQAAPDAVKIEQLSQALAEAESAQRRLEQEIRRLHPRYADLHYPQPLGLEATRALLDPQTALLEYALGDEASFLFLITAETQLIARLPSAAELAAQVKQVTAVFRNPAGRLRRSTQERAHHLFMALIPDEVAAAIAGKKNLVIVPDRSLHYLSFEALPLAAELDAATMLERWTISYVPSATVLADLATDSSPAPAAEERLDFVGFGNPSYKTALLWPASGPDESGDLPSFIEQRGNWRVSPLQESGREIANIQALFKDVPTRIFLGAEASEENVKQMDLSHARRIHFATHGLLREDRPQYSGLVLTLDEDPSEDGLFQVYEIFNLKLAADLVVLSACETGLGKELRGEGLVGLTQAFFYAGAPSLVVSLWQVADQSTAELMVRFYTHLLDGKSKAAALRAAKLDLMADERYAHPYHWAPFILIGRPR